MNLLEQLGRMIEMGQKLSRGRHTKKEAAYEQINHKIVAKQK